MFCEIESLGSDLVTSWEKTMLEWTALLQLTGDPRLYIQRQKPVGLETVWNSPLPTTPT
jgi:hypothetical protein